MNGFERGSVLLTGGIVVSLLACGSSPAQQLPPGNDDTYLPDITTACDHGNRIYRGQFNVDIAVAVVPHDPTCGGAP